MYGADLSLLIICASFLQSTHIIVHLEHIDFPKPTKFDPQTDDKECSTFLEFHDGDTLDEYLLNHGDTICDAQEKTIISSLGL